MDKPTEPIQDDSWRTYKVNDQAAMDTKSVEDAFNDLYKRIDDPPRFIDCDVKDFKHTPTGYTITVRPADKTKFLNLEIITT